MRGFRKLAIVQAKLYVREPMAAFFTLAYGPLLLVLLGVIFGNAPDPMFDGRGYLDRSVPSYMAMIIGIVGFTAVPITNATRREAGVLRRFSVTPLRPLTYFLTDVLAPFVMTLVGALLLVLIGMLAYHVRFEGNIFSLLAGLVLGALAFFGIGYALVGLIRSARTVTVIGNVALYPLILFSSAMVPLEVMPEGVRNIANYSPLTYLVLLLRGLWFGQGWGDFVLEAAVLGGLTIVSMVIIARTFRWE